MSVNSRLKLKVSDILVILSFITLSIVPKNYSFPLSISQWCVITLFLWLLVLSKISLNEDTLILALVIIFPTFFFSQAPMPARIKKFMGILIFALTFFSYIRKNSDNLDRIIRIYIKLALFASIVGIFQEIGNFLNIGFITDFRNYGIPHSVSFSGPFLRITSITTEPAHFACILFPAVYFAILQLFKKNNINFLISKTEAYIVLIAMGLTFSLIGYSGLIIISLYIGFKKGLIKFIKIGIISLFIAIFAVKYNPTIRSRVYSIFDVATNYDITTNLSAFALYSNILVTWSSFKANPFFGTGLITHQYSYNKYIGEYFDTDKILMRLNTIGAASLYLRVISEFGLWGILFIFIFIVRYRIKNVKHSLSEINNVSLIFILLYSLRMGAYLSSYLWFFIALYRQSYLNLRKEVPLRKLS